MTSAFVDVPERGYRTRCSTLLITERCDRRRERAHVQRAGHRLVAAHPARPLDRDLAHSEPAGVELDGQEDAQVVQQRRDERVPEDLQVGDP